MIRFQPDVSFIVHVFVSPSVWFSLQWFVYPGVSFAFHSRGVSNGRRTWKRLHGLETLTGSGSCAPRADLQLLEPWRFSYV